MGYILLAIAVLALFWYYPNNGPDGLLELGTYIVLAVVEVYKAFRDALVALEDRISEKVSLTRRKQAFWILFGIETVVVVISALIAENKTAWAYNILCCMPVGGILSFFNQTADFSASFTIAAWLLSGTQFMLIAFVARESEKVSSSKLIMLLHTVSFTFFSGVVLSFVINHVSLRILDRLLSWYRSVSLLMQLFPSLLIILYFIGVFVFFVISVKAFIDNLKMLGIVLLVGETLAILGRIALSLLAGSNVNTAGVRNFFAQIPDSHPFLYQLGLTISITILYNIGVILFQNARDNIKDIMEEDYDGMDDIIRDYRKALNELYEQNPNLLWETIQSDYENRCFPKQLRKMMRKRPASFCKKWVKDRRTLDQYEEELKGTEFAYNRLLYPEENSVYRSFTLTTAAKSMFLFIPIGLFAYALQWPPLMGAMYFMSAFVGVFLLFAMAAHLFRKDRKITIFDSKACWVAIGVSLLFGVLIGMRMVAAEDPKTHLSFLLASMILDSGFVWLFLNLYPVRNFLRRFPRRIKKEIRYIYQIADRQLEADKAWKLRYKKQEVSAMICCHLRRAEILAELEKRG